MGLTDVERGDRIRPTGAADGGFGVHSRMQPTDPGPDWQRLGGCHSQASRSNFRTSEPIVEMPRAPGFTNSDRRGVGSCELPSPPEPHARRR